MDRPEPGTDNARSFIIPTCPTHKVPSSSLLHAEASDRQLVAGDQCGHSGLLVSILAALSSGNPCGIKSSQTGTLRDIRIPSSEASQLNTPRHSTYLSDSVSDALIEVYLQRVNPRYPFLHGDAFLGWYRSWKASRKTEPTANQKDRWKDFFVVMVWVRIPMLCSNGD